MRGLAGRPRFLALACLCLTGCVRVGPRQEEPWRLHTLSPLLPPEAEPAETTSLPGPAQFEIGVGPIHLPGYLDQDQLVTRISQNRVILSENDRWAQPLQDNIAQVLAQNLSILLRTDQIILHPWPAPRRPTYQLEIEILAFEADTAGTARLTAQWLLRDVAERQTIAENETSLTASAEGASSERSVASLSKALEDFSRTMANVIRELRQQHRSARG